MKRMTYLWIALFCLGSFLPACVPVKEYQKMYVNDRDMDPSNKGMEKYEINMEVFREGASGANGGKSGGGCACN